MVREYSLTIDAADCIGCNACEIACKQVRGLPVGPRLIRVRPDDCREIDGRLQFRYTVTWCRQCNNPPCRDACPAGAITRQEDGIVLINGELCTGCGECIEACPFDAMQFDGHKQVALKCDLCHDRLYSGMQPACATACPSRCIGFTYRDIIGQATGHVLSE
jgi:Fe-S-cluster-containing dehydrogenase component